MHCKSGSKKCAMACCSLSFWRNLKSCCYLDWKTFVYSWVPYPTVIPNRPIRRRAIDNVTVNPQTIAFRANHECLRHIFLSGDKLFIESSTCEFSRTSVTGPMHPPMTAGSKSPNPTDKFQTLLKMWVSAIGSLLGSTCFLESLIVSACSPES